jgi:site-specific DNA recombinase
MEALMQAAIYARLSLERDANAENVDIQIRECEAYAEELGWQVVERFSDADISASPYGRKPRPSYNRLIDAVKAGEVEAILITEMPRLYRRLEELLELMHLAEITALKRIETTDGLAYDLSTAVGIHNAVAAVNTAMFESRKMSDRIRRKRKAEAQAGRAHGGTRPSGYTRGGMELHAFPFSLLSTREVIQGEVAVVREIAERLLAGESQRQLVKDLNERRVPTAQGGQWQISNLTRLMTRKRLIGIRVHKGAEYPGLWPPVLDRETWERLRLLFSGHGQGATGQGTRSYLLTGFLFCGICDKALIASASRGPKEAEPRRRYRCRRFDVTTSVETGCGKISRLAEPVEHLVTEAVLYRLDSLDMAEALADEQAPEMAGLLDTYAAQKARLDDLVADYASGLLNRDQLAHAKSVAEEALEATKARMARVERGRRLASVPAGKTLREAWDEGDLFFRRQLLSLVLERVTLMPGRAGAKRYQGFQFDPDAVRITWRI